MPDIMLRCTHRVLGTRGQIIAVCAEPLSFVGIKGEGDKTERWYRGSCGFYTAIVGMRIYRMTREEPPKGYFNHNHQELCRRSFGHAAG